MSVQEFPVTFTCRGMRLVGILHLPEQARSRAVLIVPGAPQYRAGSHRQFVGLARVLAEAGYPAFRFDYRGMGDSDGEFLSFEDVDDDLGVAVDTVFDQVDGLHDVALWGLCDGASAISFYAPRDPRIGGIVIVNPWVRTAESFARASVDTHYLGQILSAAFWRRLLTGQVDVLRSAREFLGTVSLALAKRRPAGSAERGAADSGAEDRTSPLPVRVGQSLRNFRGKVLLILSGNDLTASEFNGAVVKSEGMRQWKLRPNVRIRRLEAANHTYSREDWRRTVHEWTIEWLGAS